MEIIGRSASILGMRIETDAARAVADRSRGTPRIANRLLRRLRDFAQIAGQESAVDLAAANSAFQALEVDEAGFDEVDRKILLAIIDKFAGGPVGITTLATSVQEEKNTLEDIYEPYLIQEGFLQITPRGRTGNGKSVPLFPEKTAPPPQKPTVLANLYIQRRISSEKSEYFCLPAHAERESSCSVSRSAVPTRDKAAEIDKFLSALPLTTDLSTAPSWWPRKAG